MSPLGQLVDSAVAAAIAEHPKLFAANKDRAQKAIVRAIMKAFVRDTHDDEAEEKPQPESAPAFASVATKDPRAVAYCELRRIAGAVAPVPKGADQIYLPIEGDTTAVRAFLDCPPQKDWVFVSDRRQLTAWHDFFEATLPNVACRGIFVERGGLLGIIVPWPWPPSKTGKIYVAPCEEEIAL